MVGEGNVPFWKKKKRKYLKLSPVCPYHSPESWLSNTCPLWVNRLFWTQMKFGGTSRGRIGKQVGALVRLWVLVGFPTNQGWVLHALSSSTTSGSDAAPPSPHPTPPPHPHQVIFCPPLVGFLNRPSCGIRPCPHSPVHSLRFFPHENTVNRQESTNWKPPHCLYSSSRNTVPSFHQW